MQMEMLCAKWPLCCSGLSVLNNWGQWCIYASVTRPSLVHKMVCRQFGGKPSSEPMVVYYQMDPWDKIQWNFKQNSNIFL